MNLAIVGGGPAGLYFALLAKTRFPRATVRVYEQNARDATYGFGIVLAERGLSRLRDAHAPSYEAITAASFVSRNRVISHPDESFFIDGGFGGAIARLRLLEILETLCLDEGIHVEHGVRIEDLSAFPDADLIVHADGAQSALRREDEHAFGTMSFALTNRVAWYGTARQFAYPSLVFVRSRLGHFVAAAYAYSETKSTFVAECDAATWTREGLDRMSEKEQLQFTEDLFAGVLKGGQLISNNSLYRRLPVVRNREWFFGNRVLIGDALQNMHPTIGSGTRVAMEDAIALVDALTLHSTDMAGAVRGFRAAREAEKNKWLSASEKSFNWYEVFPKKMESLKPVEFVFDFLTRTGRVDWTRLISDHPLFTARYKARLRSERGLVAALK
jgi:2-polyprenyl-6-methoxyphenol hydroxylase-like FAD-dependent oxidoreductase